MSNNLDTRLNFERRAKQKSRQNIFQIVGGLIMPNETRAMYQRRIGVVTASLAGAALALTAAALGPNVLSNTSDKDRTNATPPTCEYSPEIHVAYLGPGESPSSIELQIDGVHYGKSADDPNPCFNGIDAKIDELNPDKAHRNREPGNYILPDSAHEVPAH